MEIAAAQARRDPATERPTGSAAGNSSRASRPQRGLSRQDLLLPSGPPSPPWRAGTSTAPITPLEIAAVRARRDPATKRRTGPVAVVQHLHGPLTPQGIRSGSFRLSVARDRIILPLGQRTHQIYQWK